MGPAVCLVVAASVLVTSCGGGPGEGSQDLDASGGLSSPTAAAALAMSCLTSSGWHVEVEVAKTKIELHYNFESDGLQRKTTLTFARHIQRDDASLDDTITYGVKGTVKSSNHVGPSVGSGEDSTPLVALLNDSDVRQLTLDSTTDGRGRVTEARIIAVGVANSIKALTGPVMTCADRPETFLDLAIAL